MEKLFYSFGSSGSLATASSFQVHRDALTVMTGMEL